MGHHIHRYRFAAIFSCILVIIIAIVYWFATEPERDPFKASAIAAPPFSSLTYGIQAFLWWDSGHVGKHLDWVELLSFSHVKQTFAWSNLEPLPGAWDWTQADRIMNEIADSRLRLVARLGHVPSWAREYEQREVKDAPPVDLAAWQAYCFAVAERYRGQIAAYQIWNEPNLSREWGGQRPDAAAYVELLAACSAAITRADPAAILISAGLAPTGNNDDTALPDDVFLDQMYRNGFQHHIDVVGVHAPGYAPPEIGPDDEDAKARWFTFRRVEDLRKIMLAYDDAARQMAIMEIGFTTDTENPAYQWFSVSEDEQAEMLLRAYDYAIANWRPWVGLMVLIYLPDPAWLPQDEEYWWSIVEADSGHPRPAFIDIANMRKVCDDFIIPQREPDGAVALATEEAPICP